MWKGKDLAQVREIQKYGGTTSIFWYRKFDETFHYRKLILSIPNLNLIQPRYESGTI